MPRRDTLESTARTQTPAGDLPGAVRRLQESARAAHGRARALGRPVLAWTAARVPLPDSLDLFARGGALAGDLMLWERPDEQISLLGIGAAWTFTADGEERFARAEAAWQSILDQAIGDDGDTPHRRVNPPEAGSPGPGPIALFGFAFAPASPPPPADQPTLARWNGYPAGLLVVPRLLVVRIGGQSWLTLALVVDPSGRPSTGPDELDPLAEQGGDILTCLTRAARPGREPGETEGGWAIEEFPPREAWKASVRQTARAVRDARLRKAVLARGLHLHGGPFDAAAALRTLRSEYPGCTLFAVTRGERCFIGATPERLVRLRGGEVTAAALAGSAPRGRTEEEDRLRGRRLLTSPKDRIEHAIVVEALHKALADICARIVVQDAPELLTLRNAHHLYTPLRAALRAPATVLSLTQRLHPTPAVAGVPREDALAWIRRHEGWDRGWYAGPIGWIDHAGEGEAAVAIRSALVEPADAFLFAGCGIVADSDPEQEYAESSLKLQPLLSALHGGRVPGEKPARLPKGQA